ncbi:MAG: galactose-1-epimerase [Aeromonas sp.]
MIPFELTSAAGLRLRGLDVGATLTSLTVPVAGEMREVLLGCADEAYATQSVWLGAVAGRFANRIGGAELKRGGAHWALDANQAPNCLHGGSDGFHRRPWQVVAKGDDWVRLTLESPTGDQGFPGHLAVTLEYRLEGWDLVVNFTATTDAPTPVSLTSHAYFNLDGDGADVRAHRVQINSDSYLPLDAASLPVAIAPVEGVFDLRTPRTIGQDWLSHPQQVAARGYDHAFLLAGNLAPCAAEVVSRDGALALQMFTDQPSVQFYSGNWLAGTPARGGEYADHAGFCLEAQQLPDSPNRPELGDPWLEPGVHYRHTTRYRFIAR